MMHSCRFPSSLSLNAAVSASAVLSSRLDSFLDVFALMLFSIECFALLPLLRRKIRVESFAHSTCRSHTVPLVNMATDVLHSLDSFQSTSLHICLTLGTVACALFLLGQVSAPTAALYAFCMVALQFGVPYWLLSLQSLKK